MNITTTQPSKAPTKRTRKGLLLSGAQGKRARRNSRSRVRNIMVNDSTVYFEEPRPRDVARRHGVVGAFRDLLGDSKCPIEGVRLAYTSQSPEYERDRIALKARKAEEAAEQRRISLVIMSGPRYDAWSLTRNARRWGPCF